jgi:hypothetical protein
MHNDYLNGRSRATGTRRTYALEVGHHQTLNRNNIMARIVGAVDFSDGRRFYLVIDRTSGIALRPLFETKAEAERWIDEQTIEYVEPSNAVATEEPVTILTDLAFDGDRRFVLHSRASAKAMWLTGPRSRDERYEENDRLLGDNYGPPEEPLN